MAIGALAALIALLEPAWLAAVAAGSVAALAILVHPLAAIPLLLFAVPFGALPRAEGEPANVSLSVAEPLVALLAIAWVARGVRRRRLTVPGGALVGTLAVFTALMLFSVTYAASAASALKETAKWLELLIVLLVVVDAAPDRRATSLMLGALLLAGAAEAAWGVVQFITRRGPAGFEVAGALRAYGNFDQPNPFGGYLATILPVAVAMALSPGSPRRLRLLAVWTGLAIASGIAVSQSRGAWLGLAVAALVGMMVWSRRARRLLVPATGTGVLVVAIALSGFLPGAFVERVAQAVEYFGVFDVRTVTVTSENWAVVERMAHWQAGWYMFLDHPWLGVGAGNYADAYPDYYLDNWVDPLGHAHNYYINTLAELGVVGLLLLLLVLGLAFRLLFRALRDGARRHDEDGLFWRALAAGILGSLVVFSVHDLFDNLLVHAINVQVGFLLGLAVLAAKRLQERHPLAATVDVR